MRTVKAGEVKKLDIIVHNGEPLGVMNFYYSRVWNDIYVTFIDSEEKILVREIDDLMEIV